MGIRRLSRRLAVALVVCSFAAPAGCNSNPPPAEEPPGNFRGDVRTYTHGIGAQADSRAGKVAGVDYAMVHYLLWEGKLALLVWGDHVVTDVAGQSKLPRNVGEQGDFSTSLGKVSVKYKTADGKSGPLTVSGHDLDISKGWLVLVSTAGGQTRVKQIQREPLPLKPDAEGGARKTIETLMADPEVVAFYAPKK